ncbi:jerky protein homolog-like [Leptopilina boulardi]|uniref:jerky protein homolog-like n=1 Tax=Leptopilina boulardi TaxID=63433 RepID=UPI0021F61DEC|nr:jerky protein homolog-like [Leptopilina boulardi]
MDETGLQFKLIPKRTYVSEDMTQVSGMKKQLEKVTVASCCNADGSLNLPLIVIGKSKNPHCFKHLNKDTDLPVWYGNQTSAWMNQTIFEEWFSKEFVPKVETFLRNKNLPLKAILLVDNCKAHKYLKVNEIEVVFFPANVTSLIQPCDQGILQALKVNYQNLLLYTIMQSSAENENFNLLAFLKTIDLYNVVIWISDAWNALKSSTIYRCWNPLWPIEKRDVAIQTEESSCTFDLLDNSVDKESRPNISEATKNDVNNLLKVFQSIQGYEETDDATLLK